MALAALATGLVACAGSTGAKDSPPVDVTPGTDLKLVAKNLKFDKKALATTANADVVLSLDNQDAATLHNVAIYKTKDGRDKVFGGDLFTGKKSVEYRFRSPGEGVYYFRCDAHPDMSGTFTVKLP